MVDESLKEQMDSFKQAEKRQAVREYIESEGEKMAGTAQQAGLATLLKTGDISAAVKAAVRSLDVESVASVVAAQGLERAMIHQRGARATPEEMAKAGLVGFSGNIQFASQGGVKGGCEYDVGAGYTPALGGNGGASIKCRF